MNLPFSATDLLEQVQAADQDTLTIGALCAGVLLIKALPGGRKGQARARPEPEANRWARRPSNTGWLRRQWWRFRPPADRMVVDGLQIDRTGLGSHCLWLAPTGGGKSSAVATLRCDGTRPVLAVMPDLSDPLRARADFVWTACDSTVPIDFLIGSPSEVAERLTEVFRSGGQGVWKMTARRATTAVIRAIDAAGAPRSLLLIGEGLRAAVKDDRELKLVCAGWVERFLATADQFGPSMAAGGVDLASLLQAGMTVVLDNDAWKHPSLGADVVAFGLAEAKRIGDQVPGGFRLIFEEAQQLGDRIDLAHPFFLAGRRRKIAVDALAQGEDGLDSILTQNARTKVYFVQEDVKLQKLAAGRLGIPYQELDPGSMADFTAWVSSGKIRRLVKFQKPPESSRPWADGVIPESADGSERMVERRMAVYEVPWNGRTRHRGTGEAEPVVFSEPPALPPPSAVIEKIRGNLYSERGCERWGGKHDKDGYGLIWLDGRWQKVHRVRWELAYGSIPRNPDGTTQTIDHLSGVCSFKDCAKLVHLELITRGGNSKRRWSAARARPGGPGGSRR